jgi:hypothetical protein
VAALVQLNPSGHHHGQLAAHIALGITWGGLVGDRRGHREGQLRVLGSPSALLRASTGQGGHRGEGEEGVREPGFCCCETP